MQFRQIVKLTSLRNEITRMRWFRATINAALLILLLLDVVLGIQVYTHGWPAKITLTAAAPGVEAVKVTPLPFTTADAWILTALVGAHVLLVYLAWHVRKGDAAPSPPR